MIATGFIISTVSLFRYGHIVKTRGGMPVQTAMLLIGSALLGLDIAMAAMLWGAA